ncbi:MAG: DMT family transporter [Mesorhizobium sp.]
MTSVSTNQPQAASVLVPIAVCAIAILVLTGMDASMKGLVLVIGVYNAIFWRSILSSAVAGSVWLARRSPIPTRRVLMLHALRAAVIGLTVMCFFWGLARIPIAEAIALSFIAPLLALLMAAVMLGERIRPAAIWASVAGLAGVAVIMAGNLGRGDYSQDALLGALSALASTGFYAYNLILARQQALVAKPLEVTFFQNFCLAVLLAFASPWLAYAVPREMWPLLCLVSALSMIGQFLMSWAYRRAEAQYLIPTEYTAFVWAVLLGWYFFGEVIGWTTIAGAALIIAGCLYAAMVKPKLAEPIEAAGV